MDYEKKYKKALQLAKSYYGKDSNEFLDTIFPELTESEDERIRTRLSEYFRGFLEGNEHCYEDGGYVKWEGLDVKSILAWLEEQKDKNCLACDQHLKGYLAGRKVTEEEKQKEQKPVDDKAFEEWLDNWYQDAKDTEGRIIMTKWEFKNWSRGIRNMYEQKSAEWSDEDDQLIGFIFDLLNDLFWRKDWAMSKEECLERLKSLRPSWKPSEEQIGCLERLIAFKNPEPEDIKGCEELLEQLKKL